VRSGITERNADSLDRLRAAAARLTPAQLAHEIDPPWTASALFAHIAFWDRFTQARWTAAREAGRDAPASIPDEALERLNIASLHQWLLLPSESAVRECLAAAEEIDGVIASLPAAAVEALGGSERVRLVDRSLHRADHLATIESSSRS